MATINFLSNYLILFSVLDCALTISETCFIENTEVLDFLYAISRQMLVTIRYVKYFKCNSLKIILVFLFLDLR